MGALLVADPIITWRRCATYLRRRDLVGAVPPGALSHLCGVHGTSGIYVDLGIVLFSLALVIRHLLYPIRLLLLHSSSNLLCSSYSYLFSCSRLTAAHALLELWWASTVLSSLVK
jgi:hypothetical protein